MKKNLFKTMLNRKCQIHVALGAFRVQAARFSEQFLHFFGEVASQANRTIGQHLHSLVAAERLKVTEIQLESAIPGRDNLPDLIEISGLAIWRKAHDLALVPIMRVAD